MKRVSSALPAKLGYRMPAEWEPHAATWLTWPRKDGISFPERFAGIPEYWVTMCRLLCVDEEVHVNVFDEAQEETVRRSLSRARLKVGERIFIHRFPAYEPWCRDHGPTFLVRSSGAGNQEPETRNRNPGVKRTLHSPFSVPAIGGQAALVRPPADSAIPPKDGFAVANPIPRSPLALVDWNYNAWGDKYPPYDLDDAIPRRVAEFLDVPMFSPDIVMEGGAIDVNGKGTLLTTESCLLNKNRNPQLTRAQIERILKNYTGAKRVLWLGDGIEGDDTDGHVDDLARFVNPTTVATVVEEDPRDANYERLQDNLRRLRTMRDQDGKRLRVVTLPMPGVVEHRGQRLPASYANFYIGNGVVLLPLFGHRNDQSAQQTLQELFPRRRVVGVNCRDLIWGLGAFHCVTQQQPRVAIP